jgi:quercetin dioxygenase-like cupin family protein
VSAFRPLAEIAPRPIWNGTVARVVNGKDITFAVVELDAFAVVAPHQHPNEQLGIVLKGLLTFTIGGETRDLRPGDTYEIPANVLHDAKAGPDGAVAIDVFSPVRADWDRFVPTAPCPPFWP